MTTNNQNIDQILRSAKRIAIVGLSEDPHKDSYRVAEYLQKHGYEIIPVNPKASQILGEKAYPDLKSIPSPVDIVDIFRKSEAVPAIVNEAIQTGAKTVWMQLGVHHPEASAKAKMAGLYVVMDECIAVHHRLLKNS